MPWFWRKFSVSGISKLYSRWRAHTLATSFNTDTGTWFFLTGEGKGLSLAKAERGMVTPNCKALHDSDSNFGMIHCQAERAVT